MKYLLLLYLFEISEQMICNKRICYGKLEDIYLLDPNVHAFYVSPTEYSENITNPLIFLENGHRFDCGNNVTSIQTDLKPWYIPKNVHVKNSCMQRQTIRRTSRPSEDINNDTEVKAMALLTIDEGHTPCNILSITDSNVTVENFDIDNAECIGYFQTENVPYYMKSSINIYASRRYITNVTMKNLKGTNDNDVMIHMMGSSNTFPFTHSSNVRFQNISNGKVMLDMICGDVESDHTHIIHSTMTNKCVLHTKEKKQNVTELFGPRIILYLNEKIFGFSSHVETYCQKNKSNTINIAAIFISVTFGFGIGVCAHILIEHIQTSNLHEKTH